MISSAHANIETAVSDFEKVTTFLCEIGIDYYVSDEDFDSFLTGIKIEGGKLKINPKTILCVGDILHEAGHLACLPLSLRSEINDDVGKSLNGGPTYELAVIAWSVAAAIHLDIPLSEVFHVEGYKGDAIWLQEQYTSKNYIGLPHLQWMGLAAFEDELVDDKILPFPNMKRWTRE